MNAHHRRTLLVAALLAAGCSNKADKPYLDALEGLRAALEQHGDTSRFGDSRVLAEAAIFHRAAGIEHAGPLSLNQSALDVFLQDIEGPTEPRTYWQRARVYLRPGRCVKLSEAELPSDARVPTPGHGWQDSVRVRHERLARKLTNAYAADFRCGDGPRFTATFTRPEPADGSYRVALITSSPRGR
jgi:hypothetical protein